jgi:quaternary ammonium compound-resistance protein SugE
MGWVFLLLACVFEVTWIAGMKYSDGLTKVWPAIFTIVASIPSFILLAQATRTLPVGTCYAVWTGVGTAGALIAGILLFQESAHPLRIVCICLILVGVVGLRLTHDETHAPAAETTTSLPTTDN